MPPFVNESYKNIDSRTIYFNEKCRTFPDHVILILAIYYICCLSRPSRTILVTNLYWESEREWRGPSEIVTVRSVKGRPLKRFSFGNVFNVPNVDRISEAGGRINTSIRPSRHDFVIEYRFVIAASVVYYQ